jgi:formylglycine-generating enzyme required for sulfatase activity
VSLPDWFQGEIPTELLRLARAHCEERVHRQILADWVEHYGGEEGQLLCRFFRRDEVLRNDASTWQTLSASEARLVAPFSDLVLGIGDRVELPLTETQNITMGWVPAGESWLGGGGGEEGTTAFTLEQGLWCGIYPVTQEQWHAVMGNNPSHFNGNPKDPMEQVSDNDVQEFLHKVNAANSKGSFFQRLPQWREVMGNNPSHFQGLPKNPVEQVSDKDVKEFILKVNAANSKSWFLYRLPTADEWEYILRGGPIPKAQSQYHFYFARSKTELTAVVSNDLYSTQANFNSNYPQGAAKKGLNLKGTSAVGNYIPNPLGMYDMHGNVWEWTTNEGFSARFINGGSWGSNGLACMASCRPVFFQGCFDNYLGFRLLAVSIEG